MHEFKPLFFLFIDCAGLDDLMKERSKEDTTDEEDENESRPDPTDPQAMMQAAFMVRT